MSAASIAFHPTTSVASQPRRACRPAVSGIATHVIVRQE
jgi:hypothetical protein